MRVIHINKYRYMNEKQREEFDVFLKRLEETIRLTPEEKEALIYAFDLLAEQEARENQNISPEDSRGSETAR